MNNYFVSVDGNVQQIQADSWELKGALVFTRGERPIAVFAKFDWMREADQPPMGAAMTGPEPSESVQ